MYKEGSSGVIKVIDISQTSSTFSLSVAQPDIALHPKNQRGEHQMERFIVGAVALLAAASTLVLATAALLK